MGTSLSPFTVCLQLLLLERKLPYKHQAVPSEKANLHTRTCPVCNFGVALGCTSGYQNILFQERFAIAEAIQTTAVKWTPFEVYFKLCASTASSALWLCPAIGFDSNLDILAIV